MTRHRRQLRQLQMQPLLQLPGTRLQRLLRASLTQMIRAPLPACRQGTSHTQTPAAATPASPAPATHPTCLPTTRHVSVVDLVTDHRHRRRRRRRHHRCWCTHPHPPPSCCTSHPHGRPPMRQCWQARCGRRPLLVLVAAATARVAPSHLPPCQQAILAASAAAPPPPPPLPSSPWLPWLLVMTAAQESKYKY